jgi:hypothetical protein
MSGPFVVTEFAALPGDEVMFVATDPNTGIGTYATNRRELADGDAEALNAAYRLGRASLEKLCRGIIDADEHLGGWDMVVELAREIVGKDTE